MSGSLASIIDRIGRVTTSRAEARVRAQVRRLATDAVLTGFVRTPPVHHFGDFNAARAILKGELRIGGFSTPLRDLTPWELDLPAPAVTKALHSFSWLDDMAALGTKAARERAQGWLLGWIDRFADGSGPGWEAEATAERFFRATAHLPFIGKTMSEDNLQRLADMLAVHEAFVAETLNQIVPVGGRILALDALIHAGRCFADHPDRGARALGRLARLCAEDISEQGGIPSRNPLELLEVFQHLLWLRDLLADEEVTLPDEIGDAIARIAPTLRTLRLGDGTLARFHGGGLAEEGALDAALADSRERGRPGDAPAMGFVRLTGGRSVAVVDTARPARGSDTAHASTLAFEFSSGRRPVLVNVGPASGILTDWARSPRATAAHNALALDKTSSSRFGPARSSGKPGLDALQTRPGMVTLSRARDDSGSWIQARHDGYLEDYGLLHERRIFMSADGRELHGEDVLDAPDQKAQRRFQARIKGAAKLGVALSLHFHAHPDVQVDIDRAQDVVHLSLPSGERWLFRHSGGLLDVEPSAWFADALTQPRETRQIVIRTQATRHEADFNWSLVREDALTRAVRDDGIDAPGG